MDERCLDCEKSFLCLSGRHPEYEHEGNLQGLVWCPSCKLCFFLVPVPMEEVQQLNGVDVLAKSLRAAEAFECPVRADSDYLYKMAHDLDSWYKTSDLSDKGWMCEDPVTGRQIAITHCPDCLPDVLRIEADVTLPKPLKRVKVHLTGGQIGVQGHKKPSKTPPSGRHKKGGGKR